MIRIRLQTFLLSAETNLFSSRNDADLVETKENGTPALKSNATSKQVSTGDLGGRGGGLFDDDDDDFFSGKSLKTSDSGECV